MQFINLVVLLAILACVYADYPEPPPTFEATKYTTWDTSFTAGNSRRSVVDIRFDDADGNPDYITMKRLDLVGTAKERGFAHGALLADDIKTFTGPKLNEYLRSMLDDLDISGLPEPVQKILKPVEKVANIFLPELAHKALNWVWKNEEEHISQPLKDEIEGMAEGVCSVLPNSNPDKLININIGKKSKKCDVNEWKQLLQEVNMLPELIRMSCTAYGAWGKSRPASSNGKLLQLRALDFGGGPFANYTVIQTHRGNPENPNNAFVSVAFPGFVGSITGVSQSGIGISEKVWMTYNEKSDIQPGNYKGVPDSFMLRNILEYSKTKEDAVKYMQSIPRTWAMWVGVGDYASQEFNLVGYKEDSAIAYNDVTMPSMNDQPYIPQVAYVDKHPQPSHDGVNGTLPLALQYFGNGQIDAFTTKQIIQSHQTGDLHAASYDFGTSDMYLTIGRTNTNGDYCPEVCPDDTVFKAYNRPWTHFSLQDFWEGK
jgi:hypothetical protein